MQNLEPKVSIIIPVYNGAEYVSKAIKSVMAQIYSNIELIIINDGSKDDSERVIRKLCEKKFSNIAIRYISQTNMGVAQARNTGIDIATGEFLMFLDQDDWLDPMCVQNLMKKAQDSCADEVIGGYRLVDQEGKVITSWKMQSKYEWSKFRIVAPWGKVFKRELIDQHQIRFLNTKISEDLYFNILFMSYTDQIEVISDIGYNWLNNNQSESHTNWNRISEDRNPIIVLEHLQGKIAGSVYLNKELLAYFFTKYIIWYLLYNVRKNKKEDIISMYRMCFGWLEGNYPSYRKWSVTGIHVPKGELIRNRVCVTVSILLHKMHILCPLLIAVGKIIGE